MKIGLILSDNLYSSPYVNYYVKFLQKNNLDYDIISWNRENIIEDVKYQFNIKHKNKNSLINQMIKLVKYKMYSNYINKICKKEKYDFLIVFTMQVGYAINKLLSKKYNKKYIFDIRDFSNIIYKREKVMRNVINNAYKIIVSSPYFQEFLNCKSTVCHNANISSISFEEKDKCVNQIYKISSIGLFIEYEINSQLINEYKNYNNINFYYIGSETEHKLKLKKYIKENNILNVKFLGKYDKKDSSNLYNSYCDFVNIIRKDTHINRYALPNKLYEGIINYKPIITNKSNYGLTKIIEEYDIGIILSDNLDDLIEKIENFDYEKFLIGRGKFLKQVIRDQENFENVLVSFFKIEL